MSHRDKKTEDNPLKPLPELTFGRSSSSSSITLPEHWKAPAVDELETLADTCQVKAEACRWAANRGRLLAQRADFQREIAPRDRAILAKAKQLDDCFLWMCSADSPIPSDEDLYEDVSNGFEAVAAGILLLNDTQMHHRTADLKPALMLLAEAQLVLRQAIQVLGGSVDSDQIRAFKLVKKMAADGHIHLTHHMRAEDTADPKSGTELLDRIQSFRRQQRETIEKQEQSQGLFEALQEKLSSICGGSSVPDSLWKEAVALIDQLLDQGISPSHRRLRDMIVPLIDLLPESLAITPGFERVLREVDRFLADGSAPFVEVAPEPTAEVKVVADLLNGRSVVLVGGDRRPPAEAAIRAAFRLKGLVWISTHPHESTAAFEPSIARQDVALVLLAIRWASHSFGEIKSFCDRIGKPLVRLPAGYNPQQIASQILNQASEVLGKDKR